VAAPDAVNVVLDPLQMVAGGTVIVNELLTVTVAVVVDVQPAAEVPVIV
jgi:hypothetical protein